MLCCGVVGVDQSII